MGVNRGPSYINVKYHISVYCEVEFMHLYVQNNDNIVNEK